MFDSAFVPGLKVITGASRPFQLSENGQYITYFWFEDETLLPSGYSLTGSRTSDIEEEVPAEEEGGEPTKVKVGELTTLTNTYTPGQTSVQVQKVWNDGENVDGKRPDKIKVQLYALTSAETESNEDVKTAVGTPVELPITEESGNESWTYIWTGLPEQVDGVAQRYEVEEVGVTEETDHDTGDSRLVLAGKDGAKYIVTYDQNGNSWIINNTYEPEKVDVPVI